jgi:hypothetical protein
MGSSPVGNAESPRGNDGPVRLRVEVIDALMLAKGATSQAEQARRFELNPGYYHRIRTGQKPVPLSTALRMARVAGTSVEALFAPVPEAVAA